MRTFLIAAVVSSLVAAPAFAQEPGSIAIELSPGDPDGDGIIDRLHVKIEVSDSPNAFGMKTMANNVVTSAPDLTAPVFARSGTVLRTSVADLTEDASNTLRRWKIDEGSDGVGEADGAITISYGVTIDPDREELALPQYELRTAAQGLSGAGLSFLVLPDDERARNVQVSWNLDGLAPDARGVSSLGIGDVRSARPLRASELASTYFMAGDPSLIDKGAFFAAWQGDLAFDGRELMDWAGQLRNFYGKFFRHTPESFGVFGRTNTLNPGSGIGLTDSFAFTFGPTSTQADLKGLLAHEMLHAWVRSLNDTIDAANGLASSWFGEGLAVHYQRVLPWRAGLIDDDAFLRDLNDTAARYYTNVLIETPNSEIPTGFWRDTRIRVLPYDRGSLYFAKVDADVRAASGGARSLDDLVRAMLAERRAGRAMDQALWERLLYAELGDEGVAAFHAMLNGGVIVPPADAFGPCFTRREAMLRRFDLGFEPEVLVSPDRIVEGLKPGSQAAQAGLRNGDRILNRFPQDAMQADQTATLTLHIEREGQAQTLTYLPRGEAVPAFQWVDQPCKAER